MNFLYLDSPYQTFYIELIEKYQLIKAEQILNLKSIRHNNAQIFTYTIYGGSEPVNIEIPMEIEIGYSLQALNYISDTNNNGGGNITPAPIYSQLIHRENPMHAKLQKLGIIKI